MEKFIEVFKYIFVYSNISNLLVAFILGMITGSLLFTFELVEVLVAYDQLVTISNQ